MQGINIQLSISQTSSLTNLNSEELVSTVESKDIKLPIYVTDIINDP